MDMTMYTDRWEGDDILVAMWTIRKPEMNFSDVPKAWLMMENPNEPGKQQSVRCITDFNTWGGISDNIDIRNAEGSINHSDDGDWDRNRSSGPWKSMIGNHK